MKKALIGYGGHAREVMAQMGVKLICFVDDEYVVEGTLPLSKFNPKKYALMVAVADSKDRFDIVQRLPKETKYFTWIHPTSLIMSDDVEIGEGSFIGAYSILTTNIKIGKHALLNRGNHIGHDCEIGDYFSAMPGTIVSGNDKIYDLVYLGTNSSIREKIKITNSVTIGMNSVVVNNIEESGVYVGVPSKKIKDIE
jgi:sugar O-acyltransferase (sialic acid O-acetyltransferase NeuD family)